MDDQMKHQLIAAAREARKNSYSLYSGYQVGAAVLTEDGTIFTGCNVENASYSATNCAERTAIFSAVAAGHRRISAIAVCGSPEGEELTQYAYPCGVCRQVMREFSDPDEMKVICAGGAQAYEEYTLSELLPKSFGAENVRYTSD